MGEGVRQVPSDPVAIPAQESGGFSVQVVSGSETSHQPTTIDYRSEAQLRDVTERKSLKPEKKAESFCVKKDSWYKPRELACSGLIGSVFIIGAGLYLLKEFIKDVAPAMSFENLKLIRND